MAFSKKQLSAGTAAYAPDPGTASRAAGLATTRRWRDLSGTPEYFWGECKSSGTAYYKVVISNLEGQLRPFCNCPVRHRFCKHNLALIEIFTLQSDAFKVTEDAPEWVLEILEKLLDDQPRYRERSEVEEATLANQRRANREKRLLEMTAGLVELEDWLVDLMRSGVAQLSGREEAYWQQLSARMVDAKLGGIGNRVRNLADLRTAPDPHAAMLAELADIYLLVRGFQRLDALPPLLQQEMLNQAGLNIKKEEVLELSGTEDVWYCCGQNEGSRDEQLFWRRTWLYGEASEQFALLLDFAYGNKPYEDAPRPGQVLSAEVIYYPSSYPQRALFRQPNFRGEPVRLRPDATLSDMATRFAAALEQNPWNNLLPAWLDGVVPVAQGSNHLLVDADRKQIALNCPERSWLRLLALSGGHPIRVFGEWNGAHFTPLTAQVGERLVLLRDHTPLPRPQRASFW